MATPENVLTRYQAVLSKLGFVVTKVEPIQPLWGGYGRLDRLELERQPVSLVIKQICFPKPPSHPRGWNTEFSHQRKLTSYQVEYGWYSNYAEQCLKDFVVPRLVTANQDKDSMLLVLEDLRSLGFTKTLDKCASPVQIQSALYWLAHFHAYFLNDSGQGLWDRGGYWHLDTRPDELAKLKDTTLKSAAHHIDWALKNAPYQTLIHGDAKLANFCFKADDSEGAAVDFQYVGRGCPMSDLVLFVSSAIEPQQWLSREAEILDMYFHYFETALAKYQPKIDADKVRERLSGYYSVAWADFIRFIKGWSPEHWKITEESERLARRGAAYACALIAEINA